MLRFLFLILFLSDPAFAAGRQLRVAAYDLSPYISQDRSEKGYIYEIVQSIYQSAGYTLDVEFYPPLRAKKLVEDGDRDILMPAFLSADDGRNLLFSQPLHGTELGYLQLIGSQQTPGAVPQDKIIGQLKEDRTRVIFVDDDGMLKSTPETTLQLIDMINLKRFYLAIADKLQVADVLVNNRPHLIGRLKFLDPPLTRKDFHLAFSRKNPNAERDMSVFDRGLQELRRNGVYERILLNYGYDLQKNDDNTLNIGVVDNQDLRVMEDLSKAYMKARPSVKIRWIPMTENLLRRRILSNIALGDRLFDVISIGNYESPIYAAKGWIQPLDPPDWYQTGDLIGPVREGLSYDGKLFALPFYAESSMTYFRKDLFDKVGINMPGQPTYSDIKSFAARIHDPGRGIYGICLRGKPGWGENMALVSTLVNVWGGRWFDGNWRPQLTSQAWEKAVGFYTDLLRKYGPPHPEKMGYNENLKAFADGKCGMWIDATVGASFVSDPAQSRVAAHVGFAKAPVEASASGSHWLWTWALALPKTTKKTALAKDFIFWATSQKYIELVARTRGWMAVPPGTRRSTYGKAAYQKAAPFSPFVLGQIESAKRNDPDAPYQGIQFVEIPEFTALGTAVGIHVAQILSGKVPLRTGLARAQHEAKSIMYHSDSFRNPIATPLSQSNGKVPEAR